jgi:hypothetical protein
MFDLLQNWRARRALRAADMLDQLVDDQLPLLAGLSEGTRRRISEHLSEVATLASAYRGYARGHLSRDELLGCADLTIERITTIRESVPSRS